MGKEGVRFGFRLVWVLLLFYNQLVAWVATGFYEFLITVQVFTDAAAGQAMKDRQTLDDGLEAPLWGWLLRRSLPAAAGSLLACALLTLLTLGAGRLGGVDLAGRMAALVFALSCWSFAAPLALGRGGLRGDASRLALHLPGVSAWTILLRGLSLSLGPVGVLLGCMVWGAISPSAALAFVLSLTAASVAFATLVNLGPSAMGGLIGVLLAMAVLLGPWAATSTQDGRRGRVLTLASRGLGVLNINASMGLEPSWPLGDGAISPTQPDALEPTELPRSGEARHFARSLLTPPAHWPPLPGACWSLLAALLLAACASRRALDVYVHGI